VAAANRLRTVARRSVVALLCAAACGTSGGARAQDNGRIFGRELGSAQHIALSSNGKRIVVVDGLMGERRRIMSIDAFRPTIE
jgi:hypothetical protein